MLETAMDRSKRVDFLTPPRAGTLLWAALGAAVVGCGDDGGGPPVPISDAGGIAACIPVGTAPKSFPDNTSLVVPDEIDVNEEILAPAAACDRAEYFIEVAAGAPTPCAGFPRAVEEALAASLEDNLCALLGDEPEQGPSKQVGTARTPPGREFDPGRFCALACADGGDPDARRWQKRGSAAFNVTLVPVFTAGNGLPLPEGAERRFFRVRIDASTGGDLEQVSLPHASVCSFLEDLRAAVEAGQAACSGQPVESVCDAPPGESIRVGRECAFPGSGLTATAEMLDWHRRRLGLDGVETPADAGARLAVIDSGAEAGLGAFPRLLPDGTPDASAPVHPHGSLLTALMLQAHRGASLASVRALGTDGVGAGLGTTAELARAIWQALAHPDLQDETARALLLNLSVGWPEVLSRPRRVRGIRRTIDENTGVWGYQPGAAVCDTVEDGPGEAVRYVLAAAHHAEPVRGAPVATFAAAGNRTHALRGDAAALAAGIGHIDCAGADLPSTVAGAWCASGVAVPDAPLFLPALWGHLGVAENPWAPAECLPPARIVEPVSALDTLDRPAAADVAVPASPLAAPGEHVYAAHPGLSAALQPIGGKCDASALGRRKQSLALTGSSVSAALTSGLASAVMAAGQAAGAAPASARGLARFLYVTGLPVAGLDGVSASRPSLDGVPVHRPNACRAQRVLEATCGAEVVACADAAPADTQVFGGADELAACVATAEACLANAEPCAPPAVAAPAAPAGYPPTGGPAASCFRSTFSGAASAVWKRTDTVAPGAVPVAAAATVGPQPPIPVCPDCLFTYDAVARKVTLTVDVNTKLPAGTIIQSPRVVVYDTRFPGTSAGSQTLNLTGTTFTMSPTIDPTKWKAGTRVVITGPAPVGSGQITASAADWRKFVKAELLCNVSGSSLITSPIDVSVLRLNVP
jgi:hypothetical protein